MTNRSCRSKHCFRAAVSRASNSGISEKFCVSGITRRVGSSWVGRVSRPLLNSCSDKSVAIALNAPTKFQICMLQSFGPIMLKRDKSSRQPWTQPKQAEQLGPEESVPGQTTNRRWQCIYGFHSQMRICITVYKIGNAAYRPVADDLKDKTVRLDLKSMSPPWRRPRPAGTPYPTKLSNCYFGEFALPVHSFFAHRSSRNSSLVVLAAKMLNQIVQQGIRTVFFTLDHVLPYKRH
jgi:hypothetical protein